MADTRKDKRAPVSLKVRFKSASIDEFIEQYSTDISHGGIFIKSKAPLEVGTLLKFELQLKDESRLIQGVGRVVWTREAYESTSDETPPGMGIKFIKMGTDSKTMVETIVSSRGDGPAAFETGTDPRMSPTFSVQPTYSSLPADADPFSDDASPDERTQVRHASEFLALALAEGGADQEAAAEAQRKAEEARKRTAELGQERGERERRSSGGFRRSSPSSPGPSRSRDSEPDAPAGDGEGVFSATTKPVQLTPAARERIEDDTQMRLRKQKPVTKATASTPAPVSEKRASIPSSPPAARVATPLPPAPRGERHTLRWVALGLAGAVIIAMGGYFSRELLAASTPDPSKDIAVKTPKAATPGPAVPTPPRGEVAIRIQSSPSGARVEIAGQDRGQTPLAVSLPAGTPTQLRLRAPGHADLVHEIRPSAETPNFDFALKPMTIALVVETTPSGAAVTVDGKTSPSPATIPITALKSPVAVAIRKDGFDPHDQTVAVEQFVEENGELRARLTVALTAKKKPAAPKTEARLKAPVPTKAAAPTPAAPAPAAAQPPAGPQHPSTPAVPPASNATPPATHPAPAPAAPPANDSPPKP